jgi:dihydrofolate reductase
VWGGTEIYTLTLPSWREVFLTRVKRTVEGDASFPAFEAFFPAPTVVRDTPEFTILHYRREAT